MNSDIYASMQFIDAVVMKLNIENNFVYYDCKNTQNSFDIDYLVNEIEKTDDGYIGTVTILIKWESNEDANSLIIDLAIQGAFIFNGYDNFSELQAKEDIKKKLSLNGIASLYSICRSRLSCIFSQICPGNNINLPMINIKRLYESKNSQDTNGIERTDTKTASED